MEVFLGDLALASWQTYGGYPSLQPGTCVQTNISFLKTRGQALETPFSPVSPEKARCSQHPVSFVL